MYSKILYFKDIYISQLKESKNKCRSISKYDITKDEDLVNLQDYLNSYNERYRKYDRIPVYYIDQNSWIKKTNLNCWNCSLNFSCPPAFIPNGYQRKLINGDDKIVMSVYGNFCSSNCAINYINIVNDKNIIDKNVSKSLLYKIYSPNGEIINPYPSYNKLCQYCGPSGITPTDYRRHYIRSSEK